MTLASSKFVKQQLLLNGWHLIRPKLATNPLEILAPLGRILPSRATGAQHHDLAPYEKNIAPPYSMSATTGTAPQPMHTDGAYYHLPPHYIALQCVEIGEAYCPTHLWVLDLARVLKEGPSILTRPDWVSRGGGRGPFYCSVLERQTGTVRIRFDPLCMRPGHAATDALDDVVKAVQSFSQQIEIEWENGLLLIIDNWRCLHARGEGAGRAPSRRLRRWTIGAGDGLVV